MNYKKPLKITSRTSSVTNGFVQAIIPSTLPSAGEHKAVLDLLGIDPANLTCVYCGSAAHHWDHLNPYVTRKRPSGFLNEARNLVPACGPCNTSKSGHPWKRWMLGTAKGSPTSRGVQDVPCRVKRLERLEAELSLSPIDFAELVQPELWSAYWYKLDEIERLLFEAQDDAIELQKQVTEGLSKRTRA